MTLNRVSAELSRAEQWNAQLRAKEAELNKNAKKLKVSWGEHLKQFYIDKHLSWPFWQG